MAARKERTSALTALSPSRAKDYLQCPKLFYFKTILGIRTPPTPATIRGNIAHYAFEHVFNHPVGERGPDTALAYIEPAWRMLIDPLVARDTVADGSHEHRLRSAEGRFRDLHDEGSPSEERLLSDAAETLAAVAGHDLDEFLGTCRDVVTGWYGMENPDKFTPTERELYVRARIGPATVHGYIDRFDAIEVNGQVRRYVSDYKTGKRPSERFADDAFFQLEVYAAALAEADGTMTDQLRLVYTAEGHKDAVLIRRVTPELLDRTRKKIVAVWNGIERAAATGQWPTRRQRLCDWCHFKDVCPAFQPELDGLLPEEIELRLDR